jgi:hypothetical protein
MQKREHRHTLREYLEPGSSRRGGKSHMFLKFGKELGEVYLTRCLVQDMGVSL